MSIALDNLDSRFARVRRCRHASFALVRCVSPVLVVFVHGADAALAGGSQTGSMDRHFVTNVAQFRALSGSDYHEGCDFELTGVVTLVDANRNLTVLQDSTGAVALHFPIADMPLQSGRRVILNGTNCSPLVARFPDYPYRPSGWDIRGSFEAPTDWGEYHLTRMRGYVRPPVSGNYRFWIASDNASELWLSADASPAGVRRIASIARFEYAAPRQWSKYPSQRSELIPLEAGRLYYIEALQEQTVGDENLSVAWQIPSPVESPIEVIDGAHLAPWNEGAGARIAVTNGILREFWTNFTAAHLTGMHGARAFESALSVQQMSVQDLGPGEWPTAVLVAPGQPLAADSNYRWVQTEGAVRFGALDETGVLLDIAADQAIVQVRVNDLAADLTARSTDLAIRVEGVCEGIANPEGVLIPGLIWVASGSCIEVIEAPTDARARLEPPGPSITAADRTVQGWYGTIGIVTFNDRVFDEEFIFVQEDTAVMRVHARVESVRDELKVGRRVDLGGALEPGRPLTTISPMFVEDLGQHPMPAPIVQPLGSSSPDQEGRWSELEGVVHAVNDDGTLHIVCSGGAARLWLGRTPTEFLAHYVDARLRVRGVLRMNPGETPLLLVPSRAYVSVQVPSPENPFGIARSVVGRILSQENGLWRSHRVLVEGEITWRDAESFFVQDDSGGVRVLTFPRPGLEVGNRVQLIAFPVADGFTRVLTKALVRPAASVERVQPTELDLNDPLNSRQNGSLVQVEATLLAQKTNSLGHVLELQSAQRVFVATLASDQGNLPELLPGSRLRLTGVCNDEATASPRTIEPPGRTQLLAALNILLRHPRDVVLLSGPPWWTWQRTSVLVGTLLTVLIVSLLWVHLLHRRLERQRLARLAFSRRVLERLEDERRRIAADLHDSLGQTLLVIKNHALLADQSLPAEQRLHERLKEISGTTSQAIEEVRRITHGLRPYQLDRLGLTQAVRASVNAAAENSPMLFASRVEDIDCLFSKEAEINVYRIVQEAVTNVVKHSGATEATVVIRKRSAMISLSVRDNGRGFDSGKVPSRMHDLGHGLSGIAERVRILGGTLTIDSRPNGGTSLIVEVPIVPPHDDNSSHSLDRG